MKNVIAFCRLARFLFSMFCNCFIKTKYIVMKRLLTPNSGISLFMGLLFVTACTKKADNTTATLQFSAQANNNLYTMSGSTITPVSASANTNGMATLNWTAGYVNATEFEFEAAKENNNDQSDTTHVQYQAQGSFRIDLFATPTALASLVIPAATYDHVQVEIQSVKSATGALNFYLKGTYKNAAGIATPIEVQLNESFAIHSEITKWQAQTLTYTSLVKMHLDLFLKNVTTTLLDNASQTNGSILISSTSNAAIYQLLVANLRYMSDVEFH